MNFSVLLLIFLFNLFSFGFENQQVIGADSNSGYENMTCQQMISENLKKQVTSLTVDNSQRIDYSKCRQHFWKSDRAKCISEITALEKKLENQMIDFVNALGIRIQIYDSLNISDKTQLSSKCKFVVPKSYNRPSEMTDSNYFQKLFRECYYTGTSDRHDFIQKLYGAKNKKNYDDRQICANFIYDYNQKKFNEPFAQYKNETAAPVSNSGQLKCPKFDCKKIQQAPTNFPNACYKMALVDCVSGHYFEETNNTTNPSSTKQPLKTGQ